MLERPRGAGESGALGLTHEPDDGSAIRSGERSGPTSGATGASLVSALCSAALFVATAAYLAPVAFLRGVVVGAAVVILLGGQAFTVFLFTGSGPQMMGGIAETWTSSELRPLRKHSWKLVDHVFYRFVNVDHLLIGAGGALVVETK